MSTENLAAEQAILAATIIGGGKADAILGLSGSDFTDTRHRVIASVLRDMIKREIPIDQLTLATELEGIGKLTTPGGAGGRLFVIDLALRQDVFPAAADFYAEEVRTHTRLRMFQQIASSTAAKMDLEDSGAHLDELLRLHNQALDAIPGPLGTQDTDDVRDSVGTLLSEADQGTDWLVPGHLARQDRVVLVAAEGVAKTTICRQLALCYAGGLNPWTGERVSDGLRVLYIDAENSRAQSRRAYRWISGRVVRPLIAPGWKERVIHKTRNDGVDLVDRDFAWFRDVADRVSPDVILLGPAYKLMRGDPQRDRDVQNLLDVIDKVRVQHNAAMIIETHAPHGGAGGRDMRPYGSSVWLRWPEIILGFQRDTNIMPEFQPAKPEYLEAVDARGRREDRDWPDRIRYGEHRELPWVPTDEHWRPAIESTYVIPEGEAA